MPESHAARGLWPSCFATAVWLCAAFLLNVNSLQAGSPERPPFSTLEIGAGSSPVMLRNSLDRFWSAGTGWSAHLSTPFYVGGITARFSYRGFSRNADGLPDFSTAAYEIHWGLSRKMPVNTAITLSAAVGVLQFRFDPNPVYAGQGSVSEIEMTAGMLAALERQISKRWVIRGALSHRTVFTNRRIHLAQADFTLGYILDTPHWLRRFLE